MNRRPTARRAHLRLHYRRPTARRAHLRLHYRRPNARRAYFRLQSRSRPMDSRMFPEGIEAGIEARRRHRPFTMLLILILLLSHAPDVLFAVGTAVHLADRGMHRLGRCEVSECTTIFADTSRTGRQRYCSQRCANRDAVRRHRARSAAQ